MHTTYGYLFAASKEGTAIRRPSNDLLQVGLRTLPIDACIQGFKNDGFAPGVMEKVLCAGILTGGKDTCIVSIQFHKELNNKNILSL